MAGKKGNGEGTIRRRGDGRWEARYTVYTPKGSTQKSVYGKTRKEVNEKLTKAQADRNQGIVYDAGNTTVGQYLDSWLDTVVRGSVRQSTFERNQQIIEAHIKPSLGKIKLEKLTPVQVQTFYREKLDSNLSPATVQKIHSVLHKALAQAVKLLMIPRNVTEAVDSPKAKAEEIHPLNSEQVEALFEAASGDLLEALYVLAIGTGMRQGEILALHWEDIDLEKGVVSIRHTLTREKGHYYIGEPKTKKSRRSIGLTPRTKEALTRHQHVQEEQRIAFSHKWENHGYVFTTETGNYINPNHLRNRSFRPLLEKAGLPKIRFHDIRHTTATLLLKQNTTSPKEVSDLLGHTTVAMTLDTYSHVLPDMRDRVVKAMETIIG